MGLDKRRTSGKIYNGSTLIVPGQQISSVKVFPITFQYKRGSKKEIEIIQILPKTESIQIQSEPDFTLISHETVSNQIKDFLNDLNIKEKGVNNLIKKSYYKLNLITFNILFTILLSNIDYRIHKPYIRRYFIEFNTGASK